jgi:hypothetical protein
MLQPCHSLRVLELTMLEDIDPVAMELLKSLPKDLPPAQYSTKDQLRVLLEAARRLRLNDAQDASSEPSPCE